MGFDHYWCSGFVPTPSSCSAADCIDVNIFHHTKRFFNLDYQSKRKLEEWGFEFDQYDAAVKTPIPWLDGVKYFKTDPRYVRFYLSDGLMVFKAYVGREGMFKKDYELEVMNKDKTVKAFHKRLRAYLKGLEILRSTAIEYEDEDECHVPVSLNDGGNGGGGDNDDNNGGKNVETDFISRMRTVPDCAYF